MSAVAGGRRVTTRAATPADMATVHAIMKTSPRLVAGRPPYEGTLTASLVPSQGRPPYEGTLTASLVPSQGRPPYEGTLTASLVPTVDELLRDGFSEPSQVWFNAVVAEIEATVVGYVLCSRGYTALARAHHVDNLYVLPQYRRQGVGYSLMRAVALQAATEGASRIDWTTRRDNVGARALYARLGARDVGETEGRLALRLDHHHIQKLATEGGQ